MLGVADCPAPGLHPLHPAPSTSLGRHQCVYSGRTGGISNTKTYQDSLLRIIETSESSSSNSPFCAALQLPQVWTQAASICPLYSLAVTAEDGRRYRNPHCAACNGRDLNTTFCDLGPGPGPRRRPASGVLARLMVPALTFLLQYTPGQVSSAHTAIMWGGVRCCLSGVRGRPAL